MKKSIKYFQRLYTRFGYRAVLFLLTSKFNNRKIEGLKIRGIKYPISLSNFKYDITTLFQIFFAKEYKVDLEREPKFIIDCGANIGLSAAYFANRYPNTKIIAIEPEAANFKMLQKNCDYYSNIVCLQKAVWPRNTILQIVDPGNGNWAIQTKETKVENGVEGITIDELMNEFGISEIDLLKIDIEGAEKELFNENFENWLGKTSCIAIELHDFMEPGVSINFYNAISLYNFTTYVNGENLICQQEIFQ